MGAFWGGKLMKMGAKRVKSWEKRKSDRWNTSPPNGESFQEAKKRITPLLNEIAIQQDVVIVAHGSLNKIIRGCWCSLSDAETLALNEPQDGFYCLVNENREYFVPV